MTKISPPRVPIYYCAECKKILAEDNKLLFVEDSIGRGFCSHQCIEHFYAPLVSSFDSYYRSLMREQGKIEPTVISSILSNINLLMPIMQKPTHLYEIKNSLDEKIYQVVGEIDHQGFGYYVLVVGLLHAGEISFILGVFVTPTRTDLDPLILGEEIRDPNTFLSFGATASKDVLTDIDSDTMTLIEHLRGEKLAELLALHSHSDISFEDFHLYDHSLEMALALPDEIYKNESNMGADLYTYILAQSERGQLVHYIVLALVELKNGHEPDLSAPIPILAFPTIDPNLLEAYRSGRVIQKSTKC